MGLISLFPEIMNQAYREYENIKTVRFAVEEKTGESVNILARGDNAEFMKFLLDGGAGCDLHGGIRQIYADPPFFSKSNYDAVIKLQTGNGEKSLKHMAYEDVWKQGMEQYLIMIAVRLMLMRDLLADDGTIWIQLD